MQVLGVGLSRTGTTSLFEALGILGYHTGHFVWDELLPVLDGQVDSFDYRCFDRWDAMTDIPTALFYNEILAAYPDCKAILTVRDADQWFKSMVKHDIAELKGWLTVAMRRLAYGTHTMNEPILKKKFIEHNRHAQQDIPNHRLLIMDILGGDEWEPLCEFLNKPIPDVPFPHNRSVN